MINVNIIEISINLHFFFTIFKKRIKLFLKKRIKLFLKKRIKLFKKKELNYLKKLIKI